VSDQTLIEKIRSLPRDKVAKVEEFVDFRTGNDDRRLTRAAARLSQDAFARSGTIRTMPTTIGCSFGDLVLVPFPFTDQTAAKKRRHGRTEDGMGTAGAG